MNKKAVGILVCMLLIIPVLSAMSTISEPTEWPMSIYDNGNYYGCGDILSVSYLGTDPPIISYGEYDVAVYYVEYWGDVEGGSKIAAKLFIPVGSPPKDGWPVKIWLHGFGGPGVDYWHWPFVDEGWRGKGYNAGMAFANHGIVSLCPWVTGCGPSEPFATYSPFSLERNAQAAFDGFTALKNLPDYFNEHPELIQPGMHLTFDHDKQIMSTNCISSPTLIYFAAHWKEHPDVSGLKAMVSDTFQPSTAYIIHCLPPSCLELDDNFIAAGMFGLWAGPVWCLAEEKGWSMNLFFTDEAIELFQTPVETPAGTMGLMRSSQLEPPQYSHVAGPILDAVRQYLGYEPSPSEIAYWLFTDDMLRLTGYTTIQEIIQDDFYQTYFAQGDPFFEENIDPFSPGVPLFVVADGDQTVDPYGVPTPADRYWCMTEPRVITLQSWGWDISVFFESGVETTSMSEGAGHTWTMMQLRELLYPLEIIKPSENWLYIFDKKVTPLKETVIVGKITIEANVYSSNDVDRVEFYIDDELRYVDDGSPYEWLWNEFAFGRHEIKAIAYDSEGNNVEDEINVMMLNI